MSVAALLQDVGAVGQMPPTDVFYERFGRALAKMRRDAGLSQEAVAARVGLSRTSVTNTEAGRQGIALHTALVFASVIGCTLPDLVAPTCRDILDLATPKGRGRRKSNRRETAT